MAVRISQTMKMIDKNTFIADRENKGCFSLGRQLTIEYYDCGNDAFLNSSQVEKSMLNAAKESGATIVDFSFHEFEPQGISGVIVIAESHFTVHAWPEYNYAAVDIFTCADNIDLETAVNSMKAAFASEHIVISSDQNRGIISKPFRFDQAGINHENTHSNPISWKKKYERRKPWGVTTIIDIYDCNPQILNDVAKPRHFVRELYQKMDTKLDDHENEVSADQKENITKFNTSHQTGTTSISGRIVHTVNTVYLDIFNRRRYEPREIAEFAAAFFNGAHYKMHVSMRQ